MEQLAYNNHSPAFQEEYSKLLKNNFQVELFFYEGRNGANKRGRTYYIFINENLTEEQTQVVIMYFLLKIEMDKGNADLLQELPSQFQSFIKSLNDEKKNSSTI